MTCYVGYKVIRSLGDDIDQDVLVAPGSGYIGYPSWLPTENDKSRRVSWPSGLRHELVYRSGKINPVYILTKNGVIYGWKVIDEYTYEVDGEIVTFKSGEIISRELVFKPTKAIKIIDAKYAASITNDSCWKCGKCGRRYGEDDGKDCVFVLSPEEVRK